MSQTVRVTDCFMIMIMNRKSYALYRMMTFSMTLTDQPGFQGHDIIWSRICHKSYLRDKISTKH